MLKTLKHHYLLIFILLFVVTLLAQNIDKPFIGHHDWNGAWYSNFARNFVKYGLWQTKFGSVMNYDYVNPDEFNYFTHYPPLLPILIFASFKIFGIHEWSARLVPLIFSLAVIIMIYWICIKFFNKRIAIFASAISAVLPIVIYFGKMPVQEVLVIAPVLLSIIFYFDYFENRSQKNLVKLVLSLVFSHLINWPGYYVTPLFFIHYMIFAKHKNKFTFALIFPSVSLFMFALHMAHVKWLTGTPLGGGLVDVFLYRLNFSDKPLGYTNFNFLKQQIRLLSVYFTRPVLLLSLATFIWLILQLKSKHFSKQLQILAMLLLFGITHNLVFRNMAFIHDYMIIYLWPYMAITGAFSVFMVIEKLRFLPRIIIFLLPFVLLATMVLERHKFVSALLASDGFLEGPALGRVINQNTFSGEKVLVLSPDFKRYFEVFTAYYADRVIDYKLTIDENSQDYRLIVAIPSRDTPQPLIDVLQQQYKMTKIDQFIIFDRNEPKQASFSNYSGL